MSPEKMVTASVRMTGSIRFSVEKTVETESTELQKETEETELKQVAKDVTLKDFSWRKNALSSGSGHVLLLHMPLHLRANNYQDSTMLLLVLCFPFSLLLQNCSRINLSNFLKNIILIELSLICSSHELPAKFHFPRLIFHGSSFFASCARENSIRFSVEKTVETESTKLQKETEETELKQVPKDVTLKDFSWRENALSSGSGPVLLLHMPLYLRANNYQDSTMYDENPIHWDATRTESR
ncbi:hypothetical protein POM88_010385 [Heracleum sosnowskyi]|uniref:Uncharacterized protein n=1 Tax=Heracleum sosnowskyi TaxID=360622 RepID=A0AAD8ISH1_9APIA|nr:hypothetical protein POM88_010385 [Heracleum sosnowskyi]